jgi:hypothetical protein
MALLGGYERVGGCLSPANGGTPFFIKDKLNSVLVGHLGILWLIRSQNSKKKKDNGILGSFLKIVSFLEHYLLN